MRGLNKQLVPFTFDKRKTWNGFYYQILFKNTNFDNEAFRKGK